MMRIVFDGSTLQQGSSASRSITGVLYFEFGGRCFPGANWSDFPVVITSWWLDSVNKLQARVEGEVQLRFMDGPYYVTATRDGADLVKLRCVEDRRVQSVLHEEHVTVAQLVECVHVLAKEIAAFCVRAGLSCRELDLLKAQLPN